jgi:toxin ParE1/3/4
MPKMRSVSIADQVEDDLDDIYTYSIENWGIKRAREYLMALRTAMYALRDPSILGHKHPDLPKYYRVYSVKSHLLVYTQNTESVTILRILHQRMNIFQHIES